MKTFVVTDREANQRFDRFLRKYFKHTPEITLGDIFSWIRKWSIKINRKKVKQNYRLLEWDTIEWDENVLTEKKVDKVLQKKTDKIAEIDLKKVQEILIYEDENRLVRNKPANTLIHPWDKHTTDITMHDIMVWYLTQTDQRNATATYSPSFCYRLDKDTSGVVISAKTYEALQYLNKLIRNRQTKKMYHAVLVWELPKKKIIVDKPLFVWYNRSTGRSQSFVNQEKWKEARSDLELVEAYHDKILWPISLVKIKIHTGRMHQIRVHANHIGYPVLGDLTYGSPPANRLASKKLAITRQLLHASSYSFFDIFSDKEIQFESPLPGEFIQLFGQ